jgi:hypothetical protein
MQDFSALDGAILIDKPAGPTSHDVVDSILLFASVVPKTNVYMGFDVFSHG